MHSLGASLVGWWNTEEEVAGLAAAFVDLANRGSRGWLIRARSWPSGGQRDTAALSR